MTKKKLYSVLLALMFIVAVVLIYEGAWEAVVPLLIATFPLIQELHDDEKSDQP